jgi:hypothetical protein
VGLSQVDLGTPTEDSPNKSTHGIVPVGQDLRNERQKGRLVAVVS